jgi:peroxiredoxin
MTLALGSAAPPFDLPGVDGADHSLDDYADAAALAVVWSCNHCPYVLAWEGRMSAIQHDYAGRGFRLVAINSNDAERYPADSFEAMKAHASEGQFPFDYLYDADQAVARAYEPERTPEVFLFDADRKLVYHGAIDDSRDEDAVSTTYLRNAIEAVLAGREPPAVDTPPVGCTVKWKA